jgi:hypothetical protein
MPAALRQRDIARRPLCLAVVHASRFGHIVSRHGRKNDIGAPGSALQTSTRDQPLVAPLTEQERCGVQRFVERDPGDILAGNRQTDLQV